MQTIGILAILSCVFGFLGFAWWGFFLVSLVMQFVILILIFSGLGNAREANLILNDNNLGSFRSKIKKAYILFIVGLFLSFLGFILLTNNNGGGIIPLIAGLILLLISAIFRIQGWGALKTFLKANYPGKASGAKLLMIATIFHMTIIGIFIGFILDIIGFFMLGSLKKLTGAPTAKPVAQPTTAPAQTQPASTSSQKFCPNCGSPVGTEKFCSACGSEI